MHIGEAVNKLAAYEVWHSTSTIRTILEAGERAGLFKFDKEPPSMEDLGWNPEMAKRVGVYRGRRVTILGHDEGIDATIVFHHEAGDPLKGVIEWALDEELYPTDTKVLLEGSEFAG